MCVETPDKRNCVPFRLVSMVFLSPGIEGKRVEYQLIKRDEVVSLNRQGGYPQPLEILGPKFGYDLPGADDLVERDGRVIFYRDITTCDRIQLNQRESREGIGKFNALLQILPKMQYGHDRTQLRHPRSLSPMPELRVHA